MKLKISTIHTPKPVIFGTALAFAVFYFWFTSPPPTTSTSRKSSNHPEM